MNPLNDLAKTVGFRRAGRTFDSPPPQFEPDGPPSTRELANEMLAFAQLPRLFASSPRLLAAPRGDGSVVFDVPGWKAPEVSMQPIRTYLSCLGYDARTWGHGTNRGSVEADVLQFRTTVERAAEISERPVGLVGWSLGGVIAREVAREIPEAVSGVVTFGSPIVGGPAHTVAARNYTEKESRRFEELIEKVNRENPLGVPITAIFTRRDGVVNWRACIDRNTEGVRHVEVGSSHLGLGLDPDVWLATAEALAAA
ncbi:MAG TPA: alpha/beta hydrolase [Solirubrobacterales bacterium]|nr:alpha/beta hydrolase [Solirubrobacterales bacterium]HNK64785.1 alpha/beta hydrolase [Solirubrobacterales bacterium]